jgi:hypothetical protein
MKREAMLGESRGVVCTLAGIGKPDSGQQE